MIANTYPNKAIALQSSELIEIENNQSLIVRVIIELKNK